MYVHTLMTIWERSTEWSTNRVVHSADWCAVWRFSHCTESEIEWNISRTLLYARVGGYLPAYSSVHHYYYLSAVALFTSADATTLQWANILVVLHHSGSMSLHNYQAHCLHLSRSSSCTLLSLQDDWWSFSVQQVFSKDDFEMLELLACSTLRSCTSSLTSHQTKLQHLHSRSG